MKSVGYKVVLTGNSELYIHYSQTRNNSTNEISTLMNKRYPKKEETNTKDKAEIKRCTKVTIRQQKRIINLIFPIL